MIPRASNVKQAQNLRRNSEHPVTFHVKAGEKRMKSGNMVTVKRATPIIKVVLVKSSQLPIIHTAYDGLSFMNDQMVAANPRIKNKRSCVPVITPPSPVPCQAMRNFSLTPIQGQSMI